MEAMLSVAGFEKAKLAGYCVESLRTVHAHAFGTGQDPLMFVVFFGKIPTFP